MGVGELCCLPGCCARSNRTVWLTCKTIIPQRISTHCRSGAAGARCGSNRGELSQPLDMPLLGERLRSCQVLVCASRRSMHEGELLSHGAGDRHVRCVSSGGCRSTDAVRGSCRPATGHAHWCICQEDLSSDWLHMLSAEPPQGCVNKGALAGFSMAVITRTAGTLFLVEERGLGSAPSRLSMALVRRWELTWVPMPAPAPVAAMLA